LAIVQTTLVFVDAKGQKANTRFYTTSDSAVHYANFLGATQPLFSALTNAAFYNAPGAIGFVASVGTYGVAADYQDITLKAMLMFVDTKGNIHRLKVPSPKRSIFMADGVTVDPANAGVIALVAGLITGTAGPTNATDRDGNGYTKFVGGLLQKTPQRRRINLFTLNPAETGPDE
jgi:hypothetical protein